MTEPNWGLDEPARSFDQGRWFLDPVHSDEPDDVPEVVAARAVRFYPTDESPLWCFVPAVWPVQERAWVRDCRVRSLSRTFSDGRSERLPWTAAEYADVENDTNALLTGLGLPPRPGGRIWLFRPPRSYPTAQAVLDKIWSDWLESGGLGTVTVGLVDFTQRQLSRVY
jgi:hypothetical protein